jgi:hypothetical protein
LYIRLAKNVATVDGVWRTSELVAIVVFHADVTGACRLEDKWHGRCGMQLWTAVHNNIGRLERRDNNLAVEEHPGLDLKYIITWLYT